MSEKKTTTSPHDFLTQMHRWRMAFFGLVILLAGTAIGASLMFLARPGAVPPPPPPDDAADILLEAEQHRLDLSPEQMQQLRPVFSKYMHQLEEIRLAAHEQITEQLRLMNEEVSSALDEQQRPRWRQDVQGLHRRFRPRSPRGRRGRSPGEGYQRRRGGSPEDFRRGPGPFGRPRGPDEPNRPWNRMNRRPPEDMQAPLGEAPGFLDRFRRGPGPFGQQRRLGPNSPWNRMNRSQYQEMKPPPDTNE